MYVYADFRLNKNESPIHNLSSETFPIISLLPMNNEHITRKHCPIWSIFENWSTSPASARCNTRNELQPSGSLGYQTQDLASKWNLDLGGFRWSTLTMRHRKREPLSCCVSQRNASSGVGPTLNDRVQKLKTLYEKSKLRASLETELDRPGYRVSLQQKRSDSHYCNDVRFSLSPCGRKKKSRNDGMVNF